MPAKVRRAAATVVSVPETLGGRARYGFDGWHNIDGPQEASVTGRAGFGALAQDGLVTLVLRPTGSDSDAARIAVRVSLDGQPVDEVTIDGRERRLQYLWNRPAAFVEIAATYQDGGAAAPIVVEVPAPWK